MGKLPENRLRISHRRSFIKKAILKVSQNLQENACVRVSLLIKGNFIINEAQAQVFSCEFCKTPSFTEHLWAIASDIF